MMSKSLSSHPDWNDVRTDHPRLFFNVDIWSGVRRRAEGPLRDHFDAVRENAESLEPPEEWSAIERPPQREDSAIDAYDWGDSLMCSALVYCVDGGSDLLERIRQMLWASIDYYHACFAQGKAVDWTCFGRLEWLAALDWVWNDLAEEERLDLARGFLQHVDEALHGPRKQRQIAPAEHRAGHYGDNNLALFAGLTLHRTGADDAIALDCLEEGFKTYQAVIAHRRKMAGESGGAATATMAYAMGRYPIAEWNYLHCMLSAAGFDRREEMAYVAGFPHYAMWNCLPGLREYGYGDTTQVEKQFPHASMYSHLSHIMHFYGKTRPTEAALAAYLRQRFEPSFEINPFCIYPYLLTELDEAPAPPDRWKLPPAHFFAPMGQVFMRSGNGSDDTYCMIAGGGLSRNHRHYDAGHFTIYKQGFLALDSGTRKGNTDNLQNYFAQTIAHNCILIKMPGEEPSPYWNGRVFAQAGGQDSKVGSEVIAFQTHSAYTYVAIDLTPVYNARKCEQMVRQFLFVMPDHFLVFDRVVAAEPEFAKTWLLHFANEPTIEGATTHADQDRGRIFCRTLLPADATIGKIGGPGKEFLVEGVNYDINAGPSQSIIDREYTTVERLDYTEVPELLGRWRLEVKPGLSRRHDVFLHLIQVGDQTLEDMADATVAREGGTASVTFEAGDRRVTVSFAESGEVGGHITIAANDEAVVDRPLSTRVTPQVGLATPYEPS